MVNSGLHSSAAIFVHPFNKWRWCLPLLLILVGCRSYDDALLDVVEKQEVGSVQRMLEGGAKADLIPPGKTIYPMEAAAEGGNPEIVRMLLAHGANPDSAHGPYSPLWLALMYGNEEAAILLVDANAQIDGPMVKGVTPFYSAVMQDYTQLVNAMMAHGADLYSPGPSGSPLHEAAENGNLQMVKLLAARGVNVNRTNDLGETPFFLALEGGFMEVAAWLAEHGADLDVANRLGNTALHAVAKANRPDLILQGCRLGADPDVQNLVGETPLHIAAAHTFTKVAAALIDSCHADLNLRESHGLSPAGLAYREGQTDMVEFLTARGGRLR